MLKSFLAALVLLPSLAAPAFAASQWIEPNDQGQIAFQTPSGNIGCLYTPDGGTDVYQPIDPGPELICERIEPAYVTLILSEAGTTRIDDPGEQGCCGGEKLRYGNTLELGGFFCWSETAGLSCETEEGEHGFLISRKQIKRW